MGPIMDNQMNFVIPAIVLYVLAGLAGIILLAACFNYVSLSVARALQRAKEVGVRKVVGANRSQILYQFLVEAVCVSLLSLLVAGIFLTLQVNGFNNLAPIQFTESQIALNFGDLWLYLIFFAFSIMVGLLSGLYPALYLSSFLPTIVLKGIARVKGKGFTLRKTLVVTQFSISLLFIISTILIYQQSEFVNKAHYGFNEKNIINVQLGNIPYETLRNELMRYPGIENISAVSIRTGTGGRNDLWIESETMDGHEKGYSVWIDENFLDNMEIPLLAGRNFLNDFSGGEESVVLVNEAAVQRLHLETPSESVGKFITIQDAIQVQIIGVVQNYRFFSALADIDPLVLRINPGNLRVANIRFHPEDFDGVVAHLETTFKSFNRDEPLKYGLYKDQLADAFELKLMRDFFYIIGLAAAFAILIACLGLLGMTAYMTETRLKEIGVRKVLGASTAGIVGFLSKSFVKLILISIVVAGPLAWYVNKLWLQNLGNRIEISPVVFILGILSLLIIALLTIGSQTVRAARTNPIEILKYE